MSDKSKVYYTSFRAKLGYSPLQKLEKLIKAAGLGELPLCEKFAAIKIHLGEDGNLAYLRPNYARVVVDTLKELGAYPFLTDCNTLYTGSRRNALDHLSCAYRNGFGPAQVDCNVLIADGLKGQDEVAVPVNGEYCQNALIGRAIMDADVIISLNHVKGHEATGFGGALKNLGMGCGSVAGKREMHCDGMPTVDERACVGCGMCTKACAFGAIHLEDNADGKGKHAVVDHKLCTGCHRCVPTCHVHSAIQGPNSSNEMLCCKIAEYAAAVTRNRPQFHINIITDVSPNCDCYPGNDMPIITPVGMFASTDAVALDTACYDACNKAMRMPGSIMDERENTGDLFRDLFPYIDGHLTLQHAQKLGMGSMDYELIEVK